MIESIPYLNLAYIDYIDLASLWSLPLSDYLKILGKIDIAIFNHERQQAVGNITSLLGLGKKVYIK